MTELGYAAAQEQARIVESALAEIAALIGAPDDADTTGDRFEPGLGLTREAEMLRERARDLEEGLFTVVVVGEFKTGKSTLLNSMLGSGALPAKATPCTAIITVLVNGTSDGVAIYEMGRAEPRVLTWEEFRREFQLSLADQETLEGGNVLGRFANVRYAQIESSHRLCSHGVRLVDSPGLGEHITRTRVTTEYLGQAQAVIVVLNATRILGQNEREFIERELATRGTQSTFFVVNRMDSLNETGVAEVRRWVGQTLGPLLAEAGDGDDLYEWRVFFVSAKQALSARLESPPDEAALAASGVPDLEDALERFLTGGDRVWAALESSLGMARSIVARALTHITLQEEALDRPLAELEKQRREAEATLETLREHKRGIERTIALFGEVIGEKVYSDLRGFIREMEERWPEDSRQLIDLDGAVSLRNLVAAYAKPGAKEEMAQSIGEEVQRYLQLKFEEWTDRIPRAIQKDVELLGAEVEAQIGEIELALDQIATAFAGKTPASGTEIRTAEIREITLSMRDIEGVTEGMLFPNDWTEVVGTMAQQAVIVFLVGTFLTGGNFALALLAVEAVHLGVHEHEAKRHVRQNLGRRLHEELRQKVEERRAFVLESVNERFRELADTVGGSIQAEIDQSAAEQERIVHRRRDEHFSASKEKDRLCAIADRLRAIESGLDRVAQ